MCGGIGDLYMYLMLVVLMMMPLKVVYCSGVIGGDKM